jgi:hypothetical protein
MPLADQMAKIGGSSRNKSYFYRENLGSNSHCKANCYENDRTPYLFVGFLGSSCRKIFCHAQPRWGNHCGANQWLQ